MSIALKTLASVASATLREAAPNGEGQRLPRPSEQKPRGPLGCSGTGTLRLSFRVMIDFAKNPVAFRGTHQDKQRALR